MGVMNITLNKKARSWKGSSSTFKKSNKRTRQIPKRPTKEMYYEDVDDKQKPNEYMKNRHSQLREMIKERRKRQ